MARYSTPGSNLEIIGGLISALPNPMAERLGTVITGMGLSRKQAYADAAATAGLGGAGRVQVGAEPKSDIVEQLEEIAERGVTELGLREGEGITSRTLEDLQQAQTDLYGGTQEAYDAARTGVRDSARDYQSSSQDYWGEAQNYYDRAAQEMMERTSGYAGDIMGAYQDRFTRNMARIENLGQSERLYLNQQYDKMNALTSQRLTDLGLSGTTVGASMMAGNERRRLQDMNALEENLMAMKFNADVGLSGDVASALERTGGYTTNLGNEITMNRYNLQTGRAGERRGIADWETSSLANLGTQEAFALPELQYNLSSGLIGKREQLSDKLSNLVTSAQVVPPDMSSYYQSAQELGYSTVPAYNPSFFGSMLGGGIGAGTGALAGALMAVPGGALAGLPYLAAAGVGAGVGYGAGSMIGGQYDR